MACRQKCSQRRFPFLLESNRPKTANKHEKLRCHDDKHQSPDPSDGNGVTRVILAKFCPAVTAVSRSQTRLFGIYHSIVV